ncbi:TonB-dependent receptor domain-containing protein, partial [Tepidimonas sp.]|uniref:TonB-dependent receptor domain-containing protein n=1 Tax=Tepidimonas sp. TaxID=2002775 RepID=UPI00391D817F
GFTPGVDDQSRHRLRTAGLHWTARWSEVWSTRASLTRGTDRYETTPSPYLTETRVTTALLRNEVRLGQGLMTVDLERREDALDNRSTTPPRTDRHQNALAVGYGWRSGPHHLQVNARHDDDSEFGGQSTGLLAYGYDVSRTLRVTASAGTAFRVPTLFQRFSKYGKPDLKAEKGRNVEAGLHWQSGADRLSVVAYRNRVRDLIGYVSGPGPCVNGVGTYAGCYDNVGRARLTGVTFSGGTRVGAVNLGASWDVMRPKNEVTDKWLARRPRTQATLTADTLVAGWRLGGEVQVVGERYDDAANTRRLAPYTLLNLTAERPLGRDWRVLARLDNATDRAYETVAGYATPGRTLFVGLSWAPR